LGNKNCEKRWEKRAFWQDTHDPRLTRSIDLLATDVAANVRYGVEYWMIGIIAEV
jgi:hypothetical protein